MTSAAIRAIKKSTPNPIDTFVSHFSEVIKESIQASILERQTIVLKATFVFNSSRIAIDCGSHRKRIVDLRSVNASNISFGSVPEETLSRNLSRALGIYREQVAKVYNEINEWTHSVLSVTFQSGQVSEVTLQFKSQYQTAADC